MTNNEEHIAPIVLFVYNRLEHTQRTVESLARNTLAKESALYIFSDAAKSEEAKEQVNKVRQYISSLKDLNYFSSIIIEESQTNKGLADAIISGVTKIIRTHSCAIVLEDDLLCAPDFLDFMNQSLTFYKQDGSIGSISGYSPLATLPATYNESIWVASRSCSLGWATWHDRWEQVGWEIENFEEFKKDKKARKRFDECGSDRYDRLRRQIETGANSWSVRFGYWQSRAGRNTVFPATTRIQHIGWDGSGVHGIYSGALDTHIKSYALSFELKAIEPDQKIKAMLRLVYSGSLLSRLAKYLRNNGFERLESTLRILVQK